MNLSVNPAQLYIRYIRLAAKIFFMGLYGATSVYAQVTPLPVETPSVQASAVNPLLDREAHIFPVQYSGDDCPDLEPEYWYKTLCTSDLIDSEPKVKAYCALPKPLALDKPGILSCKASPLMQFLGELSAKDKTFKLGGATKLQFGAVKDLARPSRKISDIQAYKFAQLNLFNESSFIFTQGEEGRYCSDALSNEIIMLDAAYQVRRRIMILSLSKPRKRTFYDLKCDDESRTGFYYAKLGSVNYSSSRFILTDKYLYLFYEKNLYSIVDNRLNIIYFLDTDSIQVVNAVWANQVLYPDAPHVSNREAYMHRVDRLGKAVFNKW